MASDKKQPKHAIKMDVARMAQVHKLSKHHRLDPIDRYAKEFGLDPDKVFWKTSFDTVFAFLEKWKDESEYNERFSYIWSELQNQTTTNK